VNLLDDTPIVPGDTHPAYEGVEQARQVLNDAEDELRNWQPHLEPIHSNAGALGAGAMPGAQGFATPRTNTGYEEDAENTHPAHREKGIRSRSGSGERRVVSDGGAVQPPYPVYDAERREKAESPIPGAF